jgi:hypothetical protein
MYYDNRRHFAFRNGKKSHERGGLFLQLRHFRLECHIHDKDCDLLICNEVIRYIRSNVGGRHDEEAKEDICNGLQP